MCVCDLSLNILCVSAIPTLRRCTLRCHHTLVHSAEAQDSHGTQTDSLRVRVGDRSQDEQTKSQRRNFLCLFTPFLIILCVLLPPYHLTPDLTHQPGSKCQNCCHLRHIARPFRIPHCGRQREWRPGTECNPIQSNSTQLNSTQS